MRQIGDNYVSGEMNKAFIERLKASREREIAEYENRKKVQISKVKKGCLDVFGVSNTSEAVDEARRFISEDVEITLVVNDEDKYHIEFIHNVI